MSTNTELGMNLWRKGVWSATFQGGPVWCVSLLTHLRRTQECPSHLIAILGMHWVMELLTCAISSCKCWIKCSAHPAHWIWIWLFENQWQHLSASMTHFNGMNWFYLFCYAGFACIFSSNFPKCSDKGNLWREQPLALVFGSDLLSGMQPVAQHSTFKAVLPSIFQFHLAPAALFWFILVSLHLPGFFKC